MANVGRLHQDLASGTFFGFNRPGATPTQGMIDRFWLQAMLSGHKNAYDRVRGLTTISTSLPKQDQKAYEPIERESCEPTRHALAGPRSRPV